MFPAILLSLAAFFIYHRPRSRRPPPGTNLPPGPTRLPIVGNLFNIPHERSWLTYTDWATTFGKVIYLEVFGSPLIVFNSVEASTELFEKRSANYADRPPMTMVNELMGWGWDMAHMRYSNWWRRHRKMFHQHFHPRAVPAYQGIQIGATGTLLHQLLESPHDFVQHIRRHSAASILRVVYSYDIKSNHSDYVALVNEAMEGLSQAVHPGSYLVDFLPILKYIPSWFPGAKFKRQAKAWAILSARLKDKPFEALKQGNSVSATVPCFVSNRLEISRKSVPDQTEEEVIKNCAGIAYLAGSDTTVSLVLTWMLAMAHYPDVQARAQVKLNIVLKRSTTPNFNDRSSLPYIDAILSETLRWNPVAPLAVPHRAIKADIYKGLYIPAGSTVVGNAWGILHDESVYPKPFEFRPERFIKEEGKDLPPDPAAIAAFGFGRRICPGRYFALNTSWIAIASILSVFTISKALDENGHEIEPVIEYTDGLVIHPKPFKLRIVPRSQGTLSP